MDDSLNMRMRKLEEDGAERRALVQRGSEGDGIGIGNIAV